MSPALDFRPDLQGLRALAVVLVVLAHAGFPGLAGGFVGVDVFFVLSGYLISGLLLRERLTTGRIRVGAFIARRFRRLLPALLVLLLATMGLASVLLSDYERGLQTASVAYAASWTSNLYFAFTTFDYFAELHVRDLFLHTWSLGVEEQFYLVWPWLMLGTLAFALRGNASAWRARATAVLLCVFVASLLLCGYWSSETSLWAFYLTPARGWQFALGALVYVTYADDGAPMRMRRLLQAWPIDTLGFVLIVASALWLHPGVVYPGAWALLPSIGAALVIAAGCRAQAGVSTRLLLAPPMVWLGDRSYSLYLWHWPLLMLGFAHGLRGNAMATTALVALAMLIAMASYRWVELPWWKGRYRALPSTVAIATALTCIGLAVLLLPQWRALSVDAGRYGEQLAMRARHDMPSIYGGNCDHWYHDADLAPCIDGSDDAPRTVVLVGDSVGAHWYSLLPALFPAAQWRIVVHTKSACPIVDEDVVYNVAGGVYTVCRQWRERVLDALDAAKPDLVVLGSASTYALSPEQWVDGSRRVLARVAASAGQVLLIPGTPMLTFDGPSCLGRNDLRDTSDVPACSESAQDKPSLRVTPLLERAAAGFDNVHLLDLNPLVCPDGRCSAITPQGVVVYRDQRHLTDTFVKAQVQGVRQRIAALGSSRLNGLLQP
ncbi:MAG: acyltransferase [Gammaproteobacteria bacterium]|nr:acyltransferase [Gammaproteobacteria bacterium]